MDAAPRSWSHDTPWRQGMLLCSAALDHFRMRSGVDDTTTCAIVISHDCDLAQGNLQHEPMVEVVVGRVVEKANGNFTWAKSPRTLHLAMRCEGLPVTLELVATNKRLLDKQALAAFDPDIRYDLPVKDLEVLRSWLASRYRRAAFPDEFVRRLERTKVRDKLASALEPHGTLISFVYFDLDGGQSVERKAGDPYELSIVLVFHPGDDAERAADAAEALAEKLEQTVRARIDGGSDIRLNACFATSEDDLTVSQARVLRHWRLEHLTMRASTPQPGPPAE